ncbi:ABC transporter substrate-binding protein [Marinomonas flavescens]|uniref:ABC transporter substrate-binding protein n=1 Tax=Marinomonas flavescens TaxID=2529379 RepID=UPI0010564CE2|nr:ABC transporter substrate-binding protein [Marinomonas flavescens]
MKLLPITRRESLSFLAGAAALILTPAGLVFAKTNNTTINFQLSWLPSVQFGGSYVAQENGYWNDKGLDVSLVSGGPNAPVEPSVVVGTSLLGITAADYASAAVAEGAPFKIIAVAMQKNPFTIASLPGNSVNSPADLVGKKIGMAVANTPILTAFCALNNIDINKIDIVPTQYDPAPLVNGEVDCLLCWLTDLPVAMTVAGVENVTMLLADYGYAVHSQTYIVTENTLKTRRAEIIALMKGEIQGWNTYFEDTDAVAELTVAKFPDLGLDLEIQKLQAAKQVDLMSSALTEKFGFGWFTDKTVAENIATLGLLGREVSADLWDRSILDEIYS